MSKAVFFVEKQFYTRSVQFMEWGLVRLANILELCD